MATPHAEQATSSSLTVLRKTGVIRGALTGAGRRPEPVDDAGEPCSDELADTLGDSVNEYRDRCSRACAATGCAFQSRSGTTGGSGFVLGAVDGGKERLPETIAGELGA